MPGRKTNEESARPGLSRERVLAAAVCLADDGGIDALTMRKLAKDLGVEAMSLYHHVANKDDILDGILEHIMAEVELPSPGPSWRHELHRTAMSSHAVFIRHPWSAGLLLSGPRVSLSRLRHMDAILGTLRQGGFSAEMTDHAYHALDSHIMGFTLWEVGISAGLARVGSVSNFLKDLDVAALPYLAEHAQQHLKRRDPGAKGEFEFGLDLILDGLERMLKP